MAAFEYRNNGLYWAVPARRITVGDRVGSLRPDGYRVFALAGKKIREHREVWCMFNGPIPEGFEVDHRNGVRDDNRIDNLRLATRSQNGMNHKRHAQNSTGVKGMGTRKRGNCLEYVGCIRANGVRHFQYSTDPAVVAEWLNKTRATLHGDFASTREG